MKLLTKELLTTFEKIGNQSEIERLDDVIVVAKFFNPCGQQTWFATEYDPEERTFFGFASLFGDHNDEWGTFSLDEFEQLKNEWHLGIERDLHFDPKPFGEARKELPGTSSANYVGDMTDKDKGFPMENLK